MTGRKTSVYLPTELDDAVKESGFTLAELVRAGLEAKGVLKPPATRADVTEVIRAELAPLLAAIKASANNGERAH